MKGLKCYEIILDKHKDALSSQAEEVPQSVAGFQQCAATLSTSAAPAWSELRFTVRIRVTYTLDFEALEEKCKISNISLIVLNIAYIWK